MLLLEKITQKYSSKNTSIYLGTDKLPYPFHQIDWGKFRNTIVFDYGCGRQETQQKIKKYLDSYLIQYIGYDAYWQSNPIERIAVGEIITCINCINTIKEDSIVQSIITFITNQGVPFIFKVYEGNKTGIGKKSKEDCYQRNTKTQDYITQFNWGKNPVKVYKNCIIRKGDEYLFKK